MAKQIIRRHYKEPVSSLNDLHPLLRRVYAARQISSPRELERELKHLHSYHLLLNIDQAADLLVAAVTMQKKILIVGDFDADGATSTAVAYRALKSFGVKSINFLVPNRFAYGYGLTPELVMEAKKFSPDLIITVDNGIANHSGVDAAKSLGISVLITDHHLPASTLPKADVIVNPNQPNDHFPSKNLAGVGVIFYVMLAVRKALLDLDWFQKNKLAEPNMSRLLDLVALGTVADLVPLDHNNRILVYQGLRRIQAGLCVPGILALLEIANRNYSRVVASDLSFAVASRLNAAGRLDDMSLGIECLISDDHTRASEIALMLNQLNDERRSIEKEMQDQAINAMEKLHGHLKGNLPRGLCLYDESWHQGVIGILASRLKDQFNRPVIVFAPGQTGELKGSGRSIANLHIRDALALMDTQNPDLILKFGGHAMAAGLTIARDLLNDFAKIFDQVVSQQISEIELQHCLYSDGELHAEDFSLEVAHLLRDAGPWGQNFPEPLFDNVFRIIDQRLVGDKHLKLRLGLENKVIDAIAFFVNTQEWPNHRCEFVRALYRLEINEYKGKQTIQLIIEYLEPQK